MVTSESIIPKAQLESSANGKLVTVHNENMPIYYTVNKWAISGLSPKWGVGGGQNHKIILTLLYRIIHKLNEYLQ